jgi:hypothetical protein
MRATEAEVMASTTAELGGCMRNVAFSILLFALALMQIAVVSSELRHTGPQTVVAQNNNSVAHQTLASAEIGRDAR